MHSHPLSATKNEDERNPRLLIFSAEKGIPLKTILSAPWMAKTHVADREVFGRGTTPTQGGGPRTTPPPTGLSSREQSLLKSRFSLSLYHCPWYLIVLLCLYLSAFVELYISD